MLDIPMFWVGPLGRLMPLACPEPGVSDPLTLLATASVSLNGRNTVKLKGLRREWSLTNSWLEPNEAAYLEAIYSNVVEGPLRIIDPLMKNRLRLAASASRKTSIWNGGSDAWGISANSGVVQNLPDADFPDVTLTTPGDLRNISYRPSTAILWDPAGTGQQSLFPNGVPIFKSDHWEWVPGRVDPVLPGETVTVSYWVKMAGSGNCYLVLLAANANGNLTNTTSVLFSNTNWQRISLTYTAPTDGSVVGVFPYFAAAGTATVTIGPGQLESGAVMTDWQPGYGAPECYISSMTKVSPRYPLVTTDLTITEL